VVNGWDERRLSQLLSRYGEEPSARRIALPTRPVWPAR